ncbi:MAG: hypothetical protein ACK4TF_07770 [Thermodesulfovibrionales bacterium]
MIMLRIKTLSGPLSSKARFDVWQDGHLIYQITEDSSNFCRTLFGFTKLRMLFPLNVEIVDLRTYKRFNLYRGVSFISTFYEIRENRQMIASFNPEKMKRLPLKSAMNYEIRDSLNRVIGSTIFKNPFIIGSQHGEVKDDKGNPVASFEWKRFSFWKGYRDCDLLITSRDENWVIISIAAAIIKGLYLQQR